MGLADYFRRSALAAAQVLGGYNESALRDRLEETRVGLALSADADSAEGRALADMSVRLLARLYPHIVLEASGAVDVDVLAALARSINPSIEISSGEADVALAIGREPPGLARTTIFAGSSAWDAHLSPHTPRAVGISSNPLGPGAAACLACANVFRAVFRPDDPELDGEIILSTLELGRAPSSAQPSLEDANIGSDAVLVGCGAIGNGCAWALAQLPFAGRVHLIDQEELDLSNLQRYVMATRAQDGERKVDLLSSHFDGQMTAVPHAVAWADFASRQGHHWEHVLVALDSAADRRAVQASLPAWIANAWTQPGDLGISIHPSLHDGACLSCLYLPAGQVPSEDEIIASALGVAHDTRGLQIRTALHDNAPPPRDLLEEAATSLGLAPEAVLAFADRPIRELYVEGICGGALLSLERVGVPSQDVHVPLAHQSALAGVLLAGRLAAKAIGQAPRETTISRLDILRPLSEYISQPAQKDRRGICMCQDPVYARAYDEKYGSRATRAPQPRVT